MDIIYTSGASESNNHVLKGITSKYNNRGNHIITTYLEHSSILSTLNYLSSQGFIIDYVKKVIVCRDHIEVIFNVIFSFFDDKKTHDLYIIVTR